MAMSATLMRRTFLSISIRTLSSSSYSSASSSSSSSLLLQNNDLIQHTKKATSSSFNQVRIQPSFLTQWHRGFTKAKKSKGEEDSMEVVPDIGPSVKSTMQSQMEAALDALSRQVGKLCTGRATAGMLDHIIVESGGPRTPVNHMVVVSVIDAETLNVMPYGPTSTIAVCRHDRWNTFSHSGLGYLGGSRAVSSPSMVQVPVRSFSSQVSTFPEITDVNIKNALKEMMSVDWDEIPKVVKANAVAALSKGTSDKTGQEALTNVLRAADAVDKFSGILVTLRMELDEMSGATGENVRPLREVVQEAIKAVYRRYSKYLDSFEPDETYLRKKVETELGRHMIYIKMRCSGLDSEWGKVTLIGTSGIAGSYIEQRS